MTKYYLKYSTTRNVNTCKKAVELAEKYDKGAKIWLKLVPENDLSDPHLPVLELIANPGNEFTVGDKVIEQIAEMYQVNLEKEFAPKPEPEPEPAQTTLSPHPSNSEIPMLEDPPLSPPPPEQPERAPRVRPKYVLYTADEPKDVVIPANGYVQMVDYDAYRMMFNEKHAPEWLAKPKALPILSTIGEEYPTLLYGQFARDVCKLLCLFNGGPAFL